MKATDTFTRDANTTAYTAGDVVGDLMTFTLGASNQDILLTSSQLTYNVDAIPASMTTFRLHLFSATPAVIADNAAFDIASGDRAKYLGYLDLGTILDFGATLAVETNNHQKHIRLPQTTGTISAYMTTAGGYTPAGNSETGTVTLHAVPAY